MATIKISDLQPAGFDLLLDSESYLQDLSSDDLMDNVVGGTSVTLTTTIYTLPTTFTRPTFPGPILADTVLV